MDLRTKEMGRSPADRAATDDHAVRSATGGKRHPVAAARGPSPLTGAALVLVAIGLLSGAPRTAGAVPRQDNTAPGSARARGESNRFNVLLIAVDDLRPELGCYGAAHAQTPNMDRLARRGVLFGHHYVQVPTCGASRYSLLTGRSPAHSQALSNSSFYRGATALPPEPLAGARSLPELFRRSGYRTVCIGKISHTPDGRVFAYDGRGDGRAELPGAWDELPTPYGIWKRGWGIFFAYGGGRHREDGQGHRDLMEFTVEEDEELPDGLLARAAVEKLAALKRGGERFFLAVGFFKPHLPWVAPRGDWEAFANVSIPPPPNPGKPPSSHWHSSGEFYGYDLPFPETHPLAATDRILARRAYLACVRYVDRQVGRVLDALEQLELDETTLVVLWGDHGWHLGDSQIWGKHTPFERALHSPLIVRVPGMSTAGRRCDALVETLDIYPTLIDICRPAQTETAWPLDGESLRPLIEDADTAGAQPVTVHPAALSYWGRFVSIRTVRHRLIAPVDRSDAADLELYDLRSGPDPLENRAAIEGDLARAMLDLIER